jgi:hypothetical protein
VLAAEVARRPADDRGLGVAAANQAEDRGAEPAEEAPAELGAASARVKESKLCDFMIRLRR